MFTIDLGAALEGTGVTVTCLHPATYMDTSMVRRAGVRPLSTVEEGARAILNLATSPAVEAQTGLYFNGLHEAKAQAQAYDLDAPRQLQALSLELTGLPLRVWLPWSDSTVARRIYARCASKTNMTNMPRMASGVNTGRAGLIEGPEVRIRLPPPVSQQRTVSAIGQRAPFGRRARSGHCRAARHSADANAGAPAPSPYYFDEWE